jgi:uncharacterized Zn-binding protein involved in type VI secretion
MRQVARVGDLCRGTCYHSSHIIPYDTTAVIVEGGRITYADDDKPVARVGDRVLATCGHYGVIVTGSDTVTAENKHVARVGDSISDVDGTDFVGTIVGGSDTVFTA